MKRVTIRDIAKKVGVTYQTVSLVVNNDPRVKPQTREKVLSAIKEMRYYPNYLGRSLAKGKTNTIAVVGIFFDSIFTSAVMNGIYRAIIDNSRYSLNLFLTKGLEENLNETLREILYGRRADAVIVITSKIYPDILEEYKEAQVPVVLLEEIQDGANTVKVDNIKGAYLATEYLIKKGKKNIVYITPDSKDLFRYERFEGYRKALEAYGRKFDSSKVINYEIRFYSHEEGLEIFESLMQARLEMDAIFCAAGDQVAAGIIEGAKKHNIRIPEELAVIGYDDLYIAPLLSPPLTTIRQPIADMGKIGYNLAVEAIENSKEIQDTKIIVLEPELIIRGTA